MYRELRSNAKVAQRRTQEEKFDLKKSCDNSSINRRLNDALELAAPLKAFAETLVGGNWGQSNISRSIPTVCC